MISLKDFWMKNLKCRIKQWRFWSVSWNKITESYRKEQEKKNSRNYQRKRSNKLKNNFWKSFLNNSGMTSLYFGSKFKLLPFFSLISFSYNSVNSKTWKDVFSFSIPR